MQSDHLNEDTAESSIQNPKANSHPKRRIPQLQFPTVAPPPPINPGVFRSIFGIRQLIDEASTLAIRASTGLSAAAIELQNASISNASCQNSWVSPHSLGITPTNEQQNGGRKTTMSPLLTHRLRVMVVQKLAAAYKLDEVATSVLVMQGSALNDIAEIVLKTGDILSLVILQNIC